MSWDSPVDDWGADNPVDTTDDNKFDSGNVNTFDSGAVNEFHAEDGQDPVAEGACRNCGSTGHFARECPEPRKMICFNCGEEGHSKSECTKPRVFQGNCNICNEAGHPAARCPSKPKICTRCKQEGDHDTSDCQNNFMIELNDVADVTEAEAWKLIATASNQADMDDFKGALRMLQKAVPNITYPVIEKELRVKSLQFYLIALKKEISEGYTLVNLQGEPGKTFTVAVYRSPDCQRPNLIDKWPASAEENLARLEDAGIPLDRGLAYCRACEKFGHSTRSCDQERPAVEAPSITCVLCGETGHRVRDCTQERRKPREPRTCKICGSEDHIAKECDQKPKFTCRNCGGEDHKAAECTEPRKLICNNCEKEGHVARDCDQPRDWSKVTCRHCGQKGHASALRCDPNAAPKQEEGLSNEGSVESHEESGKAVNAASGWDGEGVTEPAASSSGGW